MRALVCFFLPTILLCAQAVLAAETETWIDNFSVPGPVDDRYRPAWQEIPVAIGRYYSPDTAWGRRESLIRGQRFTEGTIQVTTGFVKPIPVEGHADFICSGLVIKRVGDDYVRLRLGAYGRVGLEGIIGGEKWEPEGKPLVIEPDASFQIKVVLGQGRLKVWIAGEQTFDIECPIPAEPGRTGFYCESPVWYDNYEVTGVLPDSMALSGTPKLETVLAHFRADLPDPVEMLSTHGAIELFLRNSGEGPAQLESIELDGERIDWRAQSSPIAFYDQRPWRIEPGEIGLVLLRVRGLPEKMGEAVMADRGAQPVFNLTVHWTGDITESYAVPFTNRMPSFQINFLSFSKDLMRLYIYVQNNDWIHGGVQTPVTLASVFVGGKDVTAQATFGDKAVRGDVVPIVVDLEEPLENRRHVSVVLSSGDGRWAGHSLRAFPSRTILQVCHTATWTGEKVVLGPRDDWMEDVRNHCGNTVSVVGKKYKHLVRAKELGLWSGGFGSFVTGLGAWARRWDNPAYPEIVACWMDEADKRSLGWVVERYRQMLRWQRSEGKRPPLHIMGVMGVHTPAGLDFMEVSDAVMTAYGFGGGHLEDFGRPETLPWREHRRSRRPFMPYFRNAEIMVPIDPVKKVSLPLPKSYQRCQSPEEERWMYYGSLLQGAKSVFHWLYGAKMEDGFYEVRVPLLRIGLGAAAAGRCWEYQIQQDIVDMLQATWDEIGRCNAEWRAIEDLIAISDVSTWAKVTASVPETAPDGKSAASASALLAGLDAMVIVVLNQNMERTNFNTPEGSRFTATDFTVDVRIPAWLTPQDIFRVSYKGMTDLEPKRIGDGVLRFTGTVKINDLFVITGRAGMKESIAGKLAEMQALLEKARTTPPIHTEDPSPYKH